MTSVRRSARFYDRFAKIYDLVFDGVLEPGRIESIRRMGVRAGDRVLEIGVGTGLNLPLYENDARVVGIDLSAAMLSEAQERVVEGEAPRETGLARMNALSLAFADDSFDLVYAPYVISVVSDARSAVAEMARVCRPGGRLVIVNHFGSQHRLGGFLERKLSPLTHHVGFRLDLPVESILDVPGLDKVDERRVNLLKLWRLLVFEKNAA